MQEDLLLQVQLGVMVPIQYFHRLPQQQAAVAQEVTLQLQIMAVQVVDLLMDRPLVQVLQIKVLTAHKTQHLVAAAVAVAQVRLVVMVQVFLVVMVVQVLHHL